MMSAHARLRRLLAPRHIAVVGGDAAAQAIRQCRRIGFTGDIWPVHPTRDSIEGVVCHREVARLPQAPDAAFVGVPDAATVGVVGELAAMGAGGAVCHAAGFAEADDDGRHRQRALQDAALDMPVIGPNCLGVINYLDGAALWPDQHGGEPLERGVAVISHSGNLGQNLTMQRRSLPLGMLVTVGNRAVTGVPEIIDTLLADERITAIGLHLESVDDAAALADSARRALEREIPIVVLKSGVSELGARAGVSHTSSLAGSDELADVLFARVGMGRVHDVDTFVETLKYLHVHGARPSTRLATASCSGGEAALVADIAAGAGVTMPPLPESTASRVRDVLGDRVAVANPLDYHSYVWGDGARQQDCFEAFLGAGFDAHLLVVDVPREDRSSPADWRSTVDAFVRAHRRTRTPAGVVSTLPEGLPEPVRQQLLDEGIVPLQGLAAGIGAVGIAGDIGDAQARSGRILGLARIPSPPHGAEATLDEDVAKRELAAYGVAVPEGARVCAGDAGAAATAIGYPVVAKALAPGLAHKSEAGGVHVGLADEDEVGEAVARMGGLSETFLVEQMVPGSVAELVVGVRRDAQFGLVLTIGAGGVLVELLRDTTSLLLPVSCADVEGALRRLRVWPILEGFRGGDAGDVAAAVDAIMAVAEYAHARAEGLQELDVNPLLVLPEGRGAVAADVLIRRATTEGDDGE